MEAIMHRIFVALVVAIGACAPLPGHKGDIPKPDLIADGKMIAISQCGACHAVGQGASPLADAPPLRQILHGYASEALAENFVNGVKLGHPDMPQFDFSPRETEALVAYLRSIQEPLQPARDRRVN
jgi:mono/diheme cytochrome c family protein